MSKIKIAVSLFFGLVIYSSTIIGQVQFDWVSKIAGPNNDRGNSVCVNDKTGEIYVVGSFSESCGFGNTFGLTTSSFGTDGFIAKYTSNGICLSASQIKGNGNDVSVKDITIDSIGNQYVIGGFNTQVTIGDTTLTGSGGYTDLFIAKYDINGNLVWAKRAGGGSLVRTEGNGVVVDSAENVYVVGSFRGESFFGSLSVSSSGTSDSDIFIVKYDSKGNEKWAKSAGSLGVDNGYAITVDDNNGIYISGSFFGTIVFDGTTITSKGKDDIFLAKYDTIGVLVWVKDFGGSSIDCAYSIAAEGTKYMYMAGEYDSYIDFGTTSLTSSNNRDIFISRVNPMDGSILWAKSAGGSGYDVANRITTDYAGNAYVTGGVSYSAVFDTTIVPTECGGCSNNGTDLFVAKYFSDGKFGWVTHAGGELFDDIGEGISVSNDGSEIYFTGFYESDAKFGPFLLTAFNGQQTEGFLSKIGLGGSTEISFNKYSISNQVVVFPNPSNGYFKFTSAYKNKSDVKIYSYDGNLVYHKNIGNSELINLSCLDSGIYIFQLTNGSEIYNQKVILE